MIRKLTIVTLCILTSLISSAQVDAIRIDGDNIVLLLDKLQPRNEQELLLEKFGMKGLSLDSLWEFGSIGRWAAQGWKIRKTGRNKIEIYKPVHDLSGKLSKSSDVLTPTQLSSIIAKQTEADFGVNDFRTRTVKPAPAGKTRFFLEGNLGATDVFLSGTFNEWSTLKTPMQKTDSGWVADLKLDAGKHCYKFIIDGRWIHDQENRLRDPDLYGGFNSVYFVYNHIFTLKGYEDAKNVFLTGSFVGWNERKLKMYRTGAGWQLPVYLKSGMHSYKFIVDREWITDPQNTNVQSDNRGNKNSLLAIGDTLYFRLKGYENARRVMVAGSFNGWNPNQLIMNRINGEWRLPYVLASGNYQYKFIVDGTWIRDPDNPLRGVEGGEVNSFLAVNPNHRFYLKGNLNAKEVRVAGSFNNWTGYTMTKTPEGWAIDLYLPVGKHRYKFVIDGNWIVDPDNPLWEQNEFGTGNSVLWMNPVEK